MTAFRISRETRERLDFYGVVVGTALQPAWLRWDYMREAARPRKPDSPWEVVIYPDVPFPTLNARSLSTGFGDTPDEAVDRALRHPEVRLQGRLERALWYLQAEMGILTWTLKNQINRIERPSWAFSDDLDDDIPF